MLVFADLMAVLMMFAAVEAHAWYGPICYSDHTTQVTLTIPSISGETPGDLKVDFDDNDSKVTLEGVHASKLVKNAHEVILARNSESQIGVFAVVVTSPRSTTGYKFELEFRKDPSECTGAIIKATDRSSASPRPLANKVKRPRPAPAPVEQPVEAAMVEESKPVEALPTAAPAATELQPATPAVAEPVVSTPAEGELKSSSAPSAAPASIEPVVESSSSN